MLLLLETATDICSIGISRNGEILSLVEIGERIDQAARINELILRACEEAATTLDKLDAVAISRGPGSYTSLRVGTATAKGICFALDKPLIAVDTLHSIALASRQEGSSKILYCPMIDARRMEVYTSFYNEKFKLVKAAHPLIVKSDSFATFMEQGYQIALAGNGAQKCLSILPESVFYQDIKCSAAHLSQLAQTAYREKKFEDLAYFEPLYLKPPNITKAKKRL